MNNYISIDTAIEKLNRLERESYHNSVLWPDHVEECREALREIEPADVVARDCYDRILAENDTMREQLAQIGKKPGDRMDDVQPVIKGRWLWGRGTRTCIVCGQMKATDKKDNFCSCCGADNREVKTK